MTTKTILAALIGAVVSFLLGWVVFGILMHDFYADNAVSYTGLMRGPDTRLWGIFLAQLAWSALLAYVFDRWANYRTFGSGFKGGFIIFFLAVAGFDIMSWSQMNIYPYHVILVDILANAVFGGIVGGVVAMVLGTGRKAKP